MALYNLILPKMGESVAEATIIKWNKAVGDTIDMDDAVIEIATDKVDSEVPSPVSGKLLQQLFGENDVVQVGTTIAVIETAEPGQASAPVIPAIPEPVATVQPETVAAAQPEPVAESEAPLTPPGVEMLQTKPQAAAASTMRFYSPLVKNIAVQEKVTAEELDTIPGSGADGRLTKDDLLAYIKERASKPPVKVAAPPPVVQTPKTPEPVEAVQAPAPIPAPVAATPAPQPAAIPQVPVNTVPVQQPAVTMPQPKGISLNAGDEIIEMDRMRRLIADHMVMSVHTAPHVTSFVEADVTNLVLWREKVKGQFEQRENTKLTFTPLFIEAVARAIKDMPMINVSVNGTQIIKRKDVNIGMATALPSGNLIVPVIRKADQLNLAGLSQAVNDLSARARNNKLQPDEVKDGTFTITNVGSFGNVMGTPIINQPQVAILAVGAIKKKPAVIETPKGDVIGIRHMMYLSLSYDHRVVDGSLGGSFVRRVADYLEKWDVNRLV